MCPQGVKGTSIIVQVNRNSSTGHRNGISSIHTNHSIQFGNIGDTMCFVCHTMCPLNVLFAVFFSWEMIYILKFNVSHVRDKLL